MTDSNPGTQTDLGGDLTWERNDLDRGQILGLSAAHPRSGSVIVQPDPSEFALCGNRDGRGRVADQRGAEGRLQYGSRGWLYTRPVYELLAEESDIDWQRSRIFWSDERCVSPENSDSNYRLVRETLLDRLPQAPGLIARMPGELPPERAARDYESTIREYVRADETGIPRFDLILLGMGNDGHTASLFPGSQTLSETDLLVASDFVTQIDANRLTFTYPLLNAGRHVLILVSGASKAPTLRSVLMGPHQPDVLPVQGVRPTDGQLRWLVDADAAQCIQS